MKKILVLPLILILFCNACKNKILASVKLDKEITISEIANDALLVTHSFPWAGDISLIKHTIQILDSIKK
jgi:hypothetical protein